MLDINKVQSTNTVTIIGTLAELDIVEGISSENKQYIRGTAKIRVDQSINSKPVECEIPVGMFANRLKNDGNPNSIYDGILKMRDDFISLAAAETPAQASRVAITSGSLRENIYVDKSGITRKTWQISSNFMRKAGAQDEDTAKFQLSGVIAKILPETDKEENETGRLIVNFVTVGWQGKVDALQLIAENPGVVNHINNNWAPQDTVTVAGKINMSYKVTTVTKDLGFGDPVVENHTESKHELLITGGSQTGLDEELSYDNDSIMIALGKRKERIAEIEAKAKNAKSASAPVKKTVAAFDNF